MNLLTHIAEKLNLQIEHHVPTLGTGTVEYGTIQIDDVEDLKGPIEEYLALKRCSKISQVDTIPGLNYYGVEDATQKKPITHIINVYQCVQEQNKYQISRNIAV